MKPTNLRQPERLALRHACDALVRKWWEAPVIDTQSTTAFRMTRNALIATAKDILAQEGLLGPEESELLDWATTAPNHLHTLSMRRVIKALDISEARASASLPRRCGSC